jgi:hypothetical protein
MTRIFPVTQPSTIPGTGVALYQLLIENLDLVAKTNHTVWYEGEANKLLPENTPKHAFRGGIPVGETLELLTLSGEVLQNIESAVETESGTYVYTFTGIEGPVFVSDLASSAREQLRIPSSATVDAKVYNPNFKPFEDLDDITKTSNRNAAFAVAKAVDNYLASHGDVNYSERDVLKFIQRALHNLGGEEMKYIMHSNNMMWCALSIGREGRPKGDAKARFFGTNPPDFYAKDIGTVLPGLYYLLANLGEDPVVYQQKLAKQATIWGAEGAAQHMKQYMPTE